MSITKPEMVNRAAAAFDVPADLVTGPDDHGQAAAWQDGFAAGVAAQPQHDVHVPVPVRWRVVRPGDVLLGDDGELYAVKASWIERGQRRLLLVSGQHEQEYVGDPDATARILLPVALHDALTLTREQLGGRLLALRTDGTEGS